jgi:hypothetical protein
VHKDKFTEEICEGEEETGADDGACIVIRESLDTCGTLGWCSEIVQLKYDMAHTKT